MDNEHYRIREVTGTHVLLDKGLWDTEDIEYIGKIRCGLYTYKWC